MNYISDNSGIKCLALVGSHARGDDDRYSDVDLLGISELNDHSVSNAKKINLSIYSENYIRSMMRKGDLFSLHVMKEGIPLVNGDLFTSICSEFQYKENYLREKKLAYLMGSMIESNQHSILDWNVANKRIAWCLRTFILSDMAEQRAPFFSKQNIALHASILYNSISFEEYLFLINAKHKFDHSPMVIKILGRFLEEALKFKPSEDESSDLFKTESILDNTQKQMKFDPY